MLSKVIFENTKQFKNPDGGRLKIVEKSGKPIFAGLKSVPKTNNVTCVFGSFDCPVSGKIQCDISRIIYEVTCLTCYKPCTYTQDNGAQSISSKCTSTKFPGLLIALQDVLDGNKDGFKSSYFGTSGHSAHKRALEHLNALRKGNTSYAITKHYMNEHPEVNLKTQQDLMSFKVICPSIKFNLNRFITEALAIEKMESYRDNVKILNSKTEWGCGRLRRLAVINT